jgi:hypothetical protein
MDNPDNIGHTRHRRKTNKAKNTAQKTKNLNKMGNMDPTKKLVLYLKG